MKPVIKLMDQKSNLSHIAKKYYNLEYIELLLFCFLLCFTFFSFFAIFQITEYSRKTDKSIHKIGFIHYIYIYIYLAGRDTYMFRGSRVQMKSHAKTIPIILFVSNLNPQYLVLYPRLTQVVSILIIICLILSPYQIVCSSLLIFFIYETIVNKTDISWRYIHVQGFRWNPMQKLYQLSYLFQIWTLNI
jgi:hypothetical protein